MSWLALRLLHLCVKLLRLFGLYIIWSASSQSSLHLRDYVNLRITQATFLLIVHYLACGTVRRPSSLRTIQTSRRFGLSPFQRSARLSMKSRSRQLLFSLGWSRSRQPQNLIVSMSLGLNINRISKNRFKRSTHKKLFFFRSFNVSIFFLEKSLEQA